MERIGNDGNLIEEFYYTIPQIAKFYNVSNSTIRSLIKEKKLKGQKIGKNYRILGKNFNEYLFNQNKF
ncbi:helix-turn-helix domain-containing protein [Methanococcus maripaludis]|uniref:helix-turn-helix domain-containing protein n=1 Tax=Methanococcus maripaludis TaxID=39152 RepID=UPI000CF242D2|nr:helix-turn-helix domain-containing protein [Methanococcus maripaludis]